MNFFFAILFLFSSNNTDFETKTHLPQSTPFENILIAIKTENAELLKSVFDRKTQKRNDDIAIWQERLNEGQGYFFSRFGEFTNADFTYATRQFGRILIIYYLEVEVFQKRIVKESGGYKIRAN